MIIEKIEISKLKPAKYNPRQITKKQYNDLKDSLDKFSLVEPIVVNKDMTIIGGHQRFQIWKENAEQTNVEDITIPCVVLDLNKEQERELNIRLNSSGGGWDWDKLANEWEEKELKSWGIDVWQPEESVSNTKDYSMNTADEKLGRFLDAKVKNITIPFETEEFTNVVNRLEVIMNKYNCQDYRELIYKVIENEKV